VKTLLRSSPEQSRISVFGAAKLLCQSFANFVLEPVPLMLNHFFGVMAGLVAAGLDPGRSTSFSLNARKKDADAATSAGMTVER
jgi:hypothetical protein